MQAIIVVLMVFAGVGGAVGLIVFVNRIQKHIRQKRTEEMQGVAGELGMPFMEEADEELLAKLQTFKLFNTGHGRTMRNVMKAETDLANLAIFDYSFVTGHGKHQQHHFHTIVSMQSDDLRLPSFQMRPEGFFDRVGSVLGFQDIDFDSHPEFSKSFLLKGEDEDSIRRFFDDDLLEMFERRKGISIESAPGIFIYLAGGKKASGEIRGFMDDGFAVYSAFAERLTRTSR